VGYLNVCEREGSQCVRERELSMCERERAFNVPKGISGQRISACVLHLVFHSICHVDMSC